MPRTSRKVFEVEIRGSSSPYYSNTMDGNADTTVITDEIHDVDWKLFESVRFYVIDTHDVAFDVNVESTDIKETDYTAAVDEITVAVQSGTDASGDRVAGPLGLLRYVAESVGSAPTSGSLKVIAQGLGLE